MEGGEGVVVDLEGYISTTYSSPLTCTVITNILYNVNMFLILAVLLDNALQVMCFRILPH